MAPGLPLCQPEVRLTFPCQFLPTQGTWLIGLPPFCGTSLLGGQHGGMSPTQLGEGECPRKPGPCLHAFPVRVPVAAQKAGLMLPQRS